MKKMILAVLILGLLAWPSVRVTKAQAGANDIVILPRVVHNDDPNSTEAHLKALPDVAIADTHVSHTANKFANRHDWAISVDGQDPAVFGMNDYFDFSFNLVLLGTPISPRKEAGIILTGSQGDMGQFIVNTDGHEVVAFGFPVAFYSFNSQTDPAKKVTYNSGDKINLRLHYFLGTDGKRKLEFLANGISSGPLDFTNPEAGLPGPYFVKGYVQVVIDPKTPDNRVAALYDGITWNGKLIGN